MGEAVPRGPAGALGVDCRWAARWGAAVVALVSWHAEARAGDGSGFALWEGLRAEVELAWEAGHGQAARALSEAEARAEQRVVGPWEGLTFSLAPELAPGSALRSEVSAGVGVVVRPLGTGFLGREATRRKQLARADEAAQRAAFVAGAVERCAVWIEAALELRALEAVVAELEAGLGPLREAVETKLVTALAVDGLEGELVRLKVAREAARTGVEAALAGMGAYLGREVDPGAWGELPLTVVGSPWSAMVGVEVAGGLAGHPALLRLAAEEELARAAAEAAMRVDDVRLSVQTTLRQVNEPEGARTYGGLGLELEVPLARSGAADAERSRGQAMAKRMERETSGLLLAREVRRREALERGWRRELDFLTGEARPKLEGVVARMTQAVSVGRASAESLVLARRELAEVRREELRLVARLVVSALEAAAFAEVSGLVAGPGTGRGEVRP